MLFSDDCTLDFPWFDCRYEQFLSLNFTFSIFMLVFKGITQEVNTLITHLMYLYHNLFFIDVLGFIIVFSGAKIENDYKLQATWLWFFFVCCNDAVVPRK